MKNLTSGGSSHGAPGRVDRIRVEICLGANERPTGAPRRTHPRGWATRAPADRAAAPIGEPHANGACAT
ncbi:hypothetical protein AQ964_30325 [Burkholderia pseudomallei]|nr:hypothetical protein AQ964_30325 [Burkholderia pseudomallei]